MYIPKCSFCNWWWLTFNLVIIELIFSLISRLVVLIVRSGHHSPQTQRYTTAVPFSFCLSYWLPQQYAFHCVILIIIIFIIIKIIVIIVVIIVIIIVIVIINLYTSHLRAEQLIHIAYVSNKHHNINYMLRKSHYSTVSGSHLLDMARGGPPWTT